MSSGKQGLELSKIIFIGRTFDEYVKMFDLTDNELRDNKILDAPSGACSFTAIASQRGCNVTATDIAYFHPFEELKTKGEEDIQQAMEGIAKVKEKYRWDYFNSLQELESHRMSALLDCNSHMQASPSSYIPSVMPKLPFENNQFDIILSAHFLFMYSDRLDIDFHIQTIEEMLRVTAKEVRIFPLTDLNGYRSVHVPFLIERIEQLGWKWEERIVAYEFQQNANTMLRIYKS